MFYSIFQRNYCKTLDAASYYASHFNNKIEVILFFLKKYIKMLWAYLKGSLTKMI